MSLQLNESYGLQLRDHSLPVMPLPDLTTLPHEPIHQLTGEYAAYSAHICPHSELISGTLCKYSISQKAFSWPVDLTPSFWKQVHPLSTVLFLNTKGQSKKKKKKESHWDTCVNSFFICQARGKDMEPGTFGQHPLWLAGNDVIIRGDQQMQQPCVHGGTGPTRCTLWLLWLPPAGPAVRRLLWLSGRLSTQWQVGNRPVWLIQHWVCHPRFEKFLLSANSLSAFRGRSGLWDTQLKLWITNPYFLSYL